MNPLRVGVLVSGRGTNLRALIDATAARNYPAQIVLVCANKDAEALEHARAAHIPWAVFHRADYPDREARDLAMAVHLQQHRAELIVCAGYDEVLHPAFTRAFPGRIINVHPSLLPAFAGTMDAPARALAAGVKETGCTVHLVTDAVDQGPVLAHRVVPVVSGDTPARLHARIQAEEHRLLPEVVRGIAERTIALR
ncbi:MAG TPA: phosphoribosylglycinamide formyltransferase [Candidatus Limnocylindrales bacterium]|nr:phosphoribosylglycinamide formyltransferase [Candidatus Limnocylindrales bacterium]